MRKYKRNFLIFLCIISILPLSGCWDIVEIEDRGFVMGMGLDKGENEGEIVVTYQIALPQGMFGEGAEENKTWNISAVADRFIVADKKMLARMNKVIDLEHTQVLIIGEELARDGIRKYMDLFLREIDIRLQTNVMVAEGKAKDILEVTPPTAMSTAQYLNEISVLNAKRLYRISPSMDLLKMSKVMVSNMDFLLQKLSKGEEDISLAGGAVFREDKLIGFLSDEDIRKAKWLTRDMTEGIIKFENIAGSQGATVFVTEEVRTTIKPVFYEDKVDFNVHIRIEGRVTEMEDLDYRVTESSAYIESLQSSIEELVKKECNEILKKSQDEFNADFLGLGKLVKNYNLRWWKEHEKDWRNIFKKSKLNMNVEAYVRTVGFSQ
ncbi:MAG: Ger(x)C family spore germination protein [Clostridiaceae bacterium]|nr:Ger(x)C family spore germination protein [Clostridiaceae bacterium]